VSCLLFGHIQCGSFNRDLEASAIAPDSVFSDQSAKFVHLKDLDETTKFEYLQDEGDETTTAKRVYMGDEPTGPTPKPLAAAEEDPDAEFKAFFQGDTPNNEGKKGISLICS